MHGQPQYHSDVVCYMLAGPVWIRFVQEQLDQLDQQQPDLPAGSAPEQRGGGDESHGPATPPPKGGPLAAKERPDSGAVADFSGGGSSRTTWDAASPVQPDSAAIANGERPTKDASRLVAGCRNCRRAQLCCRAVTSCNTLR